MTGNASVKFTLGVTGAAELAARLRLLSGAVRHRALLKLLREAAVPIQGRASELAPIDPATPVHLKDWIVISAATDVTVDDYQAAVAVGPAKNVFWGSFIEFGTVKQAPRPFLRPAFDYGADHAITLIREGLWKLIDDANKNAGAFTEDAT